MQSHNNDAVNRKMKAFVKQGIYDSIKRNVAIIVWLSAPTNYRLISRIFYLVKNVAFVGKYFPLDYLNWKEKCFSASRIISLLNLSKNFIKRILFNSKNVQAT